MSELIVTIGVIGSGKSYYIDNYFKNSEKYEIVYFADPLRELTWNILNWKPCNNIEYEEFKKLYMVLPYGSKLSGRELLQNIGESLRKIDKDFWLNLWYNKVNNLLKNNISVGCPDCRYLNELDLVKSLICKYYGEIIFCNYESSRKDETNTHSSEQLSQYIMNTGIYGHRDTLFRKDNLTINSIFNTLMGKYKKLTI